MALFDEAIIDADMLLGHVARRGLALPTDVDAIVRMRATLDRTTEDETKFWCALSAVAKLAEPVSAASLRAALPDGPASRAVGHYRRWAYGALMLLAAVQIYTVIGERSVADLDPTDLANTAVRVSAILNAEANGTTAPGDAAELWNLQHTLQSQSARLHASYTVLQHWRLGWHPLEALQSVLPVHVAFAATPSDQNSAAGANDAASWYTPEQIEQIMGLRSEASFALIALHEYALPFLYGLLGACIFILRSLSSDVKTLAYVSDESYQLRVPLGALSGVAIAWFLSFMQASNALKSVSPLPLAFLAGYSVEVLFTALDRLVGAFSSDSPSSPRPA